MEFRFRLERLILAYYARLSSLKEMKDAVVVREDFVVEDFADLMTEFPILLIAALHLLLPVEDLTLFPKGMIASEESKNIHLMSFLLFLLIKLFFYFVV